MYNTSSSDKLVHKLCELKLEERRVKSDIKHLVCKNKMVDFFAAKQLSGQKSNVNGQIRKLEGMINPNIIA